MPREFKIMFVRLILKLSHWSMMRYGPSLLGTIYGDALADEVGWPRHGSAPSPGTGDQP